MTHRERIIATLEGRPLDQIPWIPRLALWYNGRKRIGTLPEKYHDWSLQEIEKDLGLGTPARGGGFLSTRQNNVETKSYQDGNDTVTEYITPVGTVSTRHRGSEELSNVGIGGRMMEYMIKGVKDYAVIEYMVENTEVTPNYETYFAYDKTIGDDGFPMPGLGDCPMGRIMREYIGYNNFFYELNDHTAQVEHLCEVLTEHDQRNVWPIVAKSPAKLILHGVHFDSQFTSPPFFQKYFTPYYKEFSRLLHENEKYLACHADSDTSLILTEIMDAGFDMAECFVTYPMVPCTLQQAREAWGNNVVIWGGIPSAIVCEPITDEYFEEYMIDLFKTIAPGDAFILGVADNVMPEAKIERIQRVTEMVEEYGYPIKI